jgi:hypothetical protein
MLARCEGSTRSCLHGASRDRAQRALVMMGLLIASLGVLGALAFELLIAVRRPERIKLAQKVAA